MAKLSADTAAMVAAQLTQAHMNVLGGILAGRKPGAPVKMAPDVIESTYARYLAVANGEAPAPAVEEANLAPAKPKRSTKAAAAKS